MTSPSFYSGNGGGPRSATKTPGLGLGLPLSRELAEANGGSLVPGGSAPRGGSVFVLWLPATEEATDDGD